MKEIHALKPHTYYTLCGRDSWPDAGPRLRVGEEPTCKRCRAVQSAGLRGRKVARGA